MPAVRTGGRPLPQRLRSGHPANLIGGRVGRQNRSFLVRRQEHAATPAAAGCFREVLFTRLFTHGSQPPGRGWTNADSPGRVAKNQKAEVTDIMAGQGRYSGRERKQTFNPRERGSSPRRPTVSRRLQKRSYSVTSPSTGEERTACSRICSRSPKQRPTPDPLRKCSSSRAG